MGASHRSLTLVLEQSTRAPSYKGRHEHSHSSRSSSNTSCACANAKAESRNCCEVQHYVSIAENTKPEVASEMGDNTAEVLRYRRGSGVDSQAQGYDMEIPVKTSGGEWLMMGPLKKIATKVKVGSTESEASAPKRREAQHFLKPLPQDIPQILVQAVTPPDSKLHHHLVEDAIEDAITTNRPSPTPGQITNGQGTSPVDLVSCNRLPQNLGLATPEYTLADCSALAPHQPTHVILGALHRDGVHGYTQGLDDSLGWSTVESFGGMVQVDTQSRKNQGYTYPRVNTLPSVGVSPHLLRISPAPLLDGGLINPGSATVKSSGCAANETELATQDPSSTTVIIKGFACPPENYIHADFTAEALRRKWESSQSFTLWPKLKLAEGPVFSYNEMEDHFFRQHA